MLIELRYFDGCPHWETAYRRLSEVAAARGLTVALRLVGSPEEAEATAFAGSPTILIDGRDPFHGSDQPVGLTCRVYPTPEGPAGSPTVEQLVVAVDGDRC